MSKSIRSIIKGILKENFGVISETQKGKNIDSQINNLFSSFTIDSLDDFNKDYLTREARELLNFKLNKVLQSQYDYPNFFVVKLGNFVIKNNDETKPLAFSIEGENKKFAYPYVFIYHDTIIELRFASRFFETDAILMKEAEEFIRSKKINLNTLHEKGNKIIFDHSLDSDNIIDLTDYSKIKREEPKVKPSIAKNKASYRVGAKVNHPRFGKGTIKKTRKHETDADGNNWFNVTIDFGDKERILRMKEN